MYLLEFLIKKLYYQIAIPKLYDKNNNEYLKNLHKKGYSYKKIKIMKVKGKKTKVLGISHVFYNFKFE